MANETEAGKARRASDRGRYGRLSRERVLTAALALVDREGLSSLSMRRLGTELDVEAMSLYRYAPGKDALLDGLVEALYAELEESLDASAPPPDADTGRPASRREQLHRIARETHRIALSHPHVVPLLATRMLAVPLARRPLPVLRLQERILGLFAQAGLDERTAGQALQAVSAWLLGHLFLELRPLVDNPDETDPAFRLGLHLMPPQELPRLRAITPGLAERGGAEQLAAGLDALLDRFAPGF